MKSLITKITSIIVIFLFATSLFGQKMETGQSHILSVYPNPLRTSASFRVTFPETTDLSIRILDDLGREVLLIASENNVVGERIFPLPQNTLAAGHYICEMRSVKFSIIERVGIIKIQ